MSFTPEEKNAKNDNKPKGTLLSSITKAKNQG
jgi:hypothetical protein